MPEIPAGAKPARPTRAAHSRFAGVVIAGYAALCVPTLSRHGFNPAVFVVAGSRWVEAAGSVPRLPVQPGSDGYDGQFFYRLAQHPFSVAQAAGGIVLDHPAKRVARIAYPLLAWALSLGQPAATAWALFGANLLGLGVTAWLARLLADEMRLPGFVPIAIVLWPGFVVALMRDTAEIVAAAFCLGAVLAVVRRRPALYAMLATCALLTRETTLPLATGLLAGEALFPERVSRKQWVAACALPILVFLAWRSALWIEFPAPARDGGVTKDLGWPLLGAAHTLVGAVTGLRHWSRMPGVTRAVRIALLVSAPSLMAFCCVVATRVGRALALSRWPGVAIAWVLTVAVMSLLTARGPWVDPVAYFRAFTECYVLGCLVLGMARLRTSALQAGLLAGSQSALAWMASVALLP